MDGLSTAVIVIFLFSGFFVYVIVDVSLKTLFKDSVPKVVVGVITLLALCAFWLIAQALAKSIC